MPERVTVRHIPADHLGQLSRHTDQYTGESSSVLAYSEDYEFTGPGELRAFDILSDHSSYSTIAIDDGTVFANR